MTNDSMGQKAPEINTTVSGTGLTLIEHDGEPRVRDMVLGKTLGMARPRDIRKLIERHMPALAMFGTCATVARVSKGARGSSTATEYLLNEEQAVYIVTQSDAPNALETKVMVVKVFVAWRHGHLAPSIDALTAKETGGIVKAVLGKRIDPLERAVLKLGETALGVEKMLILMGNAMAEQDARADALAECVNNLMLAANARVAALEYVSVRELLDEAKAIQKGRRSLNATVGHELRVRALTRIPPVPLRRCPHSGVWLFPRDFANAYMAERGNHLVFDHNTAVVGQMALKFSRRRRGKAA